MPPRRRPAAAAADSVPAAKRRQTVAAKAVATAADNQSCEIAPSWAFQPEEAGGVCGLITVMMTAFYSDGIRAVLKHYLPVWRERAKGGAELQRMYDLFEAMLAHDPKFDLQKKRNGVLVASPNAYILPNRVLLDVLMKVTDTQLQRLGITQYRTPLVQVDKKGKLKLDEKGKIQYFGTIAQIYDPYFFDLLGLRCPKDIAFTIVQPHMGGRLDDVATHRFLTTEQKSFKHWVMDSLTYEQAGVKNVRPKVLSIHIKPQDNAPAPITPEVITFHGCKYVLDACQVSGLIPWQVTGTGRNSPGHWVTGVTCGGVRYVHDGTDRTHDPTRPCPLYKYDWANPTAPARLNRDTCQVEPYSYASKDFKFDFRSNRVAFYVRVDPPITAAEVLDGASDEPQDRTCPRGKVKNTYSNRCVKQDGEVARDTPWAKATLEPVVRKQPTRAVKKTGKKASAAPRRPAVTKSVAAGVKKNQTPDDCNGDTTKVRNPRTGRCVQRDGKIGRQVLRDMQKK